jgi:hypothetical protein
VYFNAINAIDTQGGVELRLKIVTLLTLNIKIRKKNEKSKKVVPFLHGTTFYYAF